MYPACLTTFALITAGATSTRGVTALVMKKLHKNRINRQPESMEVNP